jgi:Fe-S-cluster containining protein
LSNVLLSRDAGPFGVWLEGMRAVLRGERDADVPCGSCVGCCVSSYPIPLRPGDRVALARLPAQFLLRVASSPSGDSLMGFRDDGTCPMYADQQCSIYKDRPQTCRDYDCRIFAASGTLPAGERRIINERVQEWRFSFPQEEDRAACAAVRRAAEFILAHSADFPSAVRASSPTAAAVLAIKTYSVFVDGAPVADGAPAVARQVTHILEAARAFDSGKD